MSYITNQSTFFKAVNMVASKMEGHRSARMKLAYAIVTECRMTDINTLFNREEMTALVKLVVSSGITLETAEAHKETKRAKTVTKRKLQKLNKVSKEKNTSEPAQKELIYLPVQLDSLYDSNLDTDQISTVYEIIHNYVTHANKNEGKHLEAHVYNFNDGIQALSNVTDTQDLQSVMVAYFMRDYARKMIIKMLDLGIGYKKLNTAKSLENIEQKQSYMKASSNKGNITAFEVDDILNDLIVDSYRLTFSENMFDSISNAMASIYWRVSNVIQVRTRELRNQTKVVTAQKQYVQEEGATRSTEEEAFQMALEMGIFTTSELEIIELRIAGMKKKEIDSMLGKRTDRTFNNMKKSYSQAV